MRARMYGTHARLTVVIGGSSTVAFVAGVWHPHHWHPLG